MSPEQQGFLNTLLDASLSRACDALEKNDDIKPFASYLGANGDVVFSADLDDKTLEENPEYIVADFEIILKRTIAEEGVTFVGVTCQVRVQNPQTGEYTPAVECCIDCENGRQYDCFLPFTKQGDRYEYGSIFCNESESDKFK